MPAHAVSVNLKVTNRKSQVRDILMARPSHKQWKIILINIIPFSYSSLPHYKWGFLCFYFLIFCFSFNSFPPYILAAWGHANLSFRPGTKLMSPAAKEWNRNHWTIRGKSCFVFICPFPLWESCLDGFNLFLGTVLLYNRYSINISIEVLI